MADLVTYFPGRIDVYANDFTWVGTIGNPISITGSVVFNGLSVFQIELSADDPIISDLVEPGARVTMIYRDADLFSGVVTALQGSILRNGSITVTLESDWRILTNTLAFIRPANQVEATAISVKNNDDPTAQAQAWLPGGALTQGTSGTTIGQTGYYYWNPSVVYAETAIKTLITENAVTRLGRPVTVATDLHRGGDIKTPGLLPSLRLETLEAACGMILGLDGLGLKLQQVPRTSTITADVFIPGTWDMPLTAESGVIAEGSWSFKAPTMTRAFLGGPGDVADRYFKSFSDTTGLEAEYNDIVEVFQDASSGADIIWPEGLTVEELKVAKYYLLRSDVSAANKAAFSASIAAVASQSLAEGVPRYGINAVLSETETFHFGGSDGIQLGDTVTIKSITGTLFTEQITQCDFEFGNGIFNVTPILGHVENDPNQQLAHTIAHLARAQRRISKDR
jgi:hypothetical protein